MTPAVWGPRGKFVAWAKAHFGADGPPFHSSAASPSSFWLLKEWAYAGMALDLTGASASHTATGDPAAKVATPLIILLIVIASWVLRPERRRLRAAGLT